MNSFVCLPHPALKQYISHYCYANYTTKKLKEQGSFPYGGAVISISLRDEPYYFEMNNVVYSQKSNLAGILEKATYIQQNKNLNFFLIFLTPLGIYKHLGIPQSKFANVFIDLEDTLKGSAQLREQLALATTRENIIHTANTYFLKKMNREEPKPNLYEYSLKIMQESYGTIRIKKLCNHLQISQRSFERNFKYMVGLTPKSYNRMVRLQHIYDKLLCNIHNTNPYDIIYKLGYFDQAHFIHDLKKYTSRTPRMIQSSSHELYHMYFNS